MGVWFCAFLASVFNFVLKPEIMPIILVRLIASSRGAPARSPLINLKLEVLTSSLLLLLSSPLLDSPLLLISVAVLQLAIGSAPVLQACR